MEKQELLGFKDFLKLLAENIEKNAGKIKVIATIMHDITNKKEYKEIAELAKKIFEEKYYDFFLPSLVAVYGGRRSEV